MHLRQAILAMAVLVAGGPCLAQGFVNVYEIPHNVSINVISNQFIHQNLNETLHHWDAHEAQQKKKKPASASTGSLTPSAGLGISALTKNLPKEETEKGRAAYRQACDYHEQVIKKFGLQSGDLGVALASCIAGAWMAYNNKSFPDEFYLPLVSQMRRLVGSNGSVLQAATAAERSGAYENLAIAGMIMASSQITWERNPQAPGADGLRKRMREQGGDVLTRMLQVPPERVGIGAAGVFAMSANGKR